MAPSERDAAGIMARAAAAREESGRLALERARLRTGFQATVGSALAARTERVDAGIGSAIDRDRIRRLAAAVGRDPVIEDAKALLQDQHGITGAQAFELLRYLSQHQNRKLREIARAIVAERSQEQRGPP